MWQQASVSLQLWDALAQTLAHLQRVRCLAKMPLLQRLGLSAVGVAGWVR